MVKFVWLDEPAGGRVPVNPDQVAYLRQVDGVTHVVFGAVPGGVHSIAVAGDGDDVAKRLEEGLSAPEHLPERREGFNARKGKRRTPKAPQAVSAPAR